MDWQPGFGPEVDHTRSCLCQRERVSSREDLCVGALTDCHLNLAAELQRPACWQAEPSMLDLPVYQERLLQSAVFDVFLLRGSCPGRALQIGVAR